MIKGRLCQEINQNFTFLCKIPAKSPPNGPPQCISALALSPELWHIDYMRKEVRMIRKVRSHHDFMFNYLHALIVSFKRPAMVFIFFFMVSIVSSVAYLVYKFENLQNDGINSYFDALYFTVTIITGVGLGDIAPVTFNGRVLSMLTMLAGTSLFVGATAVIASSIINIERSSSKK